MDWRRQVTFGRVVLLIGHMSTAGVKITQANPLRDAPHDGGANQFYMLKTAVIGSAVTVGV